MNNALRAGPSAVALAIKLVIAIAWIGASGYASWVLLNETSKVYDILAALFLFIAPVAWTVYKAIEVKLSDELYRNAGARGLIHGLRFAALWPCLMLGGSVLSSLFLGDGEVNVSGLMQNAVTYIAIMPAIAVLLSETMSFSLLWSYARRQE